MAEDTGVKLTQNEITESLTGYEENELFDNFGENRGYAIAERGLLFILKRREGLGPKEAKRAVMQMPMKAVLEVFSDEDDSTDAVDEEMLTEAGKDESRSGDEPSSSPLGA